MQTLEQIKEQIQKLESSDEFGTKKEIQHLPEILRPDEIITGLTSGMMNGNTWLITCTNYRVIFLDKGMFFGLKQVETPLDKINSIEQETGLIFGSITIWDGSSKMLISNVMKGTVKPFVTALNNEIDKVKSSNGTTNTSNDIATQLEKLAALKDKGIITEDEFVGQKTKLLAS